ILIRGIKLVKPDAFGPVAVKPQEDPMVQFRSQNDSLRERDIATKAIATLSKLPFQDHPTQVEKFLLIQKDFTTASQLYDARQYADSLSLFKSVNARINDFSLSIQTKQEAQNLYNALLLKIKDMEVARPLAPDALNAATTAAADSNRLLQT